MYSERDQWLDMQLRKDFIFAQAAATNSEDGDFTENYAA